MHLNQATLQWGQRAELGTLVSGVVAEVPVRAGQSVNKGALLVTLDDRGFRARVQGAQAAVTRTGVRFEEAKREQERAIELYDRTVLSEHERQLAEIALAEAGRQALGWTGLLLVSVAAAFSTASIMYWQGAQDVESRVITSTTTNSGWP